MRVPGERQDTGRIEPITVFEEADGGTRIPLRFEPFGSMFVVFQPGQVKAADRIVSVKLDGRELVEMDSAAPIAANRDVTGTFTMAAWVKPDIEIALPQETNKGIEANSLERNDVLYPPPGHEVWTEQDAGAGFGVGKNGVCVYEHGGFYFPALLVHAAPITDWTHVAVVYRDGTPSLYLNGKLARTGLKGQKTVHSGVGVDHSRELREFRGQVAGLQQFRQALADEEIGKLASTKPAFQIVSPGPAVDLIRRVLTEDGTYVFGMGDRSKTREVTVSGLPSPMELGGPWEVRFEPGRGAPEKVAFDRLVSWSEHPEHGVKYFSGHATYRKTFEFAPTLLTNAALHPVVSLDLGSVAVMAAVTVNGKDLGVLWKPPYRVDITDTVRPGANLLEIRVVNLQINRMLGDELLPEDSDRDGEGKLKQWPQWLQEGKPSPSGRYTFTSWRLWKKGGPLQESGLLGPVTIRTGARIR